MTTTTAIIKSALRESNLISLVAAPTADQQTEAMSLLASVVAGVYGYSVGENLRDWIIGYDGQYLPNLGWNYLRWRWLEQNTRVVLNQTDAQTLYMPRRPNEGARIQVVVANGDVVANPVTLDGNGFLIDGDATLVIDAADDAGTWIFNAEAASWELVEVLALGDDMPFPLQFDDFFIIKLAARLNPRYGRSLTNETIARLQEMQEQIESFYRQKRAVPAPLALRRLQTPNQWWNYWGGRGPRGWLG